MAANKKNYTSLTAVQILEHIGILTKMKGPKRSAGSLISVTLDSNLGPWAIFADGSIARVCDVACPLCLNSIGVVPVLNIAPLMPLDYPKVPKKYSATFEEVPKGQRLEALAKVLKMDPANFGDPGGLPFQTFRVLVLAYLTRYCDDQIQFLPFNLFVKKEGGLG